MVLLKDCNSDEYVIEMSSKKEQKKEQKSIGNEVKKIVTNNINFGDDIDINTLCIETLPCQHWVNKDLLRALDIYKLLDEKGYIHSNNLSDRQINIINHFAYQIKKPIIKVTYV